MRNKRKLLIDHLDEKLEPFKNTELVLIPVTGWINTIRTALNMTLAQLGNKLNTTRQGAKYLEEREIKGTITINALNDFAQALNLKFVYGFVPKDLTFDNLVNIRAEKIATKIVMRTNQNMSLEDQNIDDEKLKLAIKDLADDLKREMRKTLWD